MKNSLIYVSTKIICWSIRLMYISEFIIYLIRALLDALSKIDSYSS